MDVNLLILFGAIVFPWCVFFPQYVRYIFFVVAMLGGQIRIPYHAWDWCISLHEWLIIMVNVGKYTIHGWYGNAWDIF